MYILVRSLTGGLRTGVAPALAATVVKLRGAAYLICLGSRLLGQGGSPLIVLAARWAWTGN